MSEEPTQKNRSISIQTPLGDDKLLLTRFEYSDELNMPFRIDADVLSTDPVIAFDQIIGQPVTISMNLASGTKRCFHGIVLSFEQKDRTIGAAVYCLQIVPWLRHFGNSSDCQIFQNENIPDIVSKVLKTAGFSDLELQLTDNYPPLEYCVQYRESGLSFVNRLLAKAGIAYYFRHEEARHVMVLTDSVKSHSPFPRYDILPYRESESAATLEETISNWGWSMSAKTGAYAQTDFDFKRPKADLLVKAPVSRSHGMADFERFDYPGEYDESGQGDAYAKARINEIHTGHEIARGVSSCRALATGRTFKLQDHPRADQNREYLLTSVSLSFNAGGFTAGVAGFQPSTQETFACGFSVMPSTQQYRPARSTSKPLITGPQTAIVTGPAGEEIHTDKYGRVKVHFHWDRYGKFDADSSCWIRVSQYWAGKNWGAMHIPRMGQEVIVEFLEGDPDKPIITGRVYNGEAKPPYALPANKNISTLMSNSTKGGGGYNEIKMDDTKSAELLYIQAEKDRTVLVKHDNTETVHHDETIEIGNDRSKHVLKNEDVTIDENRTEEVKKNEDITIGVDRTEEVKNNEKVKIGRNRTHDVGEIDKLTVGDELVINVGKQITIMTGESSIVMKKDGTIKISGKNISIVGTGKILAKADSDVVIKGQNSKDN